VDQNKVVMKNMNGEPVLPTDEDYAGLKCHRGVGRFAMKKLRPQNLMRS
jgi:hypothetical protein